MEKTGEIKKLERTMEKLRIRALERETLELLKTTHWGRIYAAIYFIIGFGSIFLYSIILKFTITSSILLGFLTWIIIALIGDKILIKTHRIDKQLKWFLETPEGLAELKRKGITDEEIEKLKETIKNDPLYKKFSFENYKNKSTKVRKL
jgi:ABC-type bacteriocin/lantibiotic exporter with double-glycine peptidase domain